MIKFENFEIIQIENVFMLICGSLNNIRIDITAPLYWWNSFDRCRSNLEDMDFITPDILEKEFTLDDFSHEDLFDEDSLGANVYSLLSLRTVIFTLNRARELYLKTDDERYWKQIIQLLPSSYNLKKTVNMGIETIFFIYNEKKNDSLSEWIEFCRWIESFCFQEK